MVALVQALSIPPDEPTPWKDALAGLDGRAARTQAMFGDPAPKDWGVGGLTLSGTGEGGGGRAAGIAPDSAAIDSLPPVPDHPLPPRDAFRSRARSDLAAAVASIAEDAVKRVVRANGSRFGQCYSAGLRRDPSLAGRVVVAFTLDEHGSVTAAHDDPTSDLADEGVRACIVARFFSLRFAPPRSAPFSAKYSFPFGSAE
jgi:hypothetical protein